MKDDNNNKVLHSTYVGTELDTDDLLWYLRFRNYFIQKFLKL